MTGRPVLRLVHLYPLEMNIYGDRGNVITLVKRLEWRSIGVEVIEVGPGDPVDLLEADLVFGGGGQDAGQAVVADDLVRRRHQLHDARDGGVPMLVICGTYQLFGHRFVTASGQELAGTSVLSLETTAGTNRLIGNVVVESPFGRLVGFENHGGRTRLDADQASLGRVVKGNGNNGETGEEGAVTGNVFGTYLHGPVLPKNPALADELIGRALRRRYGIADLDDLDDRIESAAASTAEGRPR